MSGAVGVGLLFWAVGTGNVRLALLASILLLVILLAAQRCGGVEKSCR
jgi:hypothetical protein